MNDVMLDLETLGTSPGSVILSIGAVYFDSGGLGDTFSCIIDRKTSLDVGLTTDFDTLLWWKNQSPEARKVLEDGGLPLPIALRSFNDFLAMGGEDVRVWGNGSDFDNVLLIAAFKAAGITLGWKFRNNRCFRTIKNLTKVPEPVRAGTYHNALDDAKHQARWAIIILKSAV